jgi:hypothetical protein
VQYDQQRCPECGRFLLSSHFDAAFATHDGEEQLYFGLPGRLCRACEQLYLDRSLVEVLELPSGYCTFAIESDHVLLADTLSG